MGCMPKKSCWTNSSAVAPNPDPSMYKVLSREVFDNSTLIVAEYIGCTNFEGKKVMVFRGNFTPYGNLDPHFSNLSSSPLARFKPTEEGLKMAREFADKI